MNKIFLTLIACMLISANAKFFRGANLLKTGNDFLKSIHFLGGSADFQGAGHYEHTHRGDVEHKATESGMSTEAHITSEIAINLGAKMPGYIAQVREILETQVDTGVTFCGNQYERVSGTGAGKKLSEIVGTAAFSPNHAYTDSAVSYDGVVAENSQISETDDVHQCGNSNCVSGSVVASVAQFIRSQGYHINHADICRARGSVRDITSRTCNLVTSPSLVKSFNCKKKSGFSDQWKYDRECAAFGINYRIDNNGNANTDYNSVNGDSPCDAAANCVENDDNCIYNTTKLAALDGGYLCEEDVENAIVPFPCSYISAGAGLSDSNGGTCTPVKNQLKRILKYGVISGGKADIDDSTIVTGAADGCTSLRGIVLAINGNKLERTYVSKQHNAAEDYWQGQIDDTRAIIKTIREKIINLQGLGNFFYPLENSDKYECDSEFGPYEQGIDAGTAEDPKCDLVGTDYSSFQGIPHTKSMAIRASCFCRSFADSGDEFYLTTTQVNETFCNTNFKEKLPSVYTYCRNHKQLGETDTWKATLDQLLFSPNDIPTNLDTWFFGASAEIKSNFEKSIAGQGTKCGRVSSANTKLVKFSNKGGNCVPIQGIQDIVYRLEFEYFNSDASVKRKGTGNTYADKMCVANPDGDQILSFRQLAYVWQRIYTSNATGGTIGLYHVETDTNNDNIEVNNPKSQFYDDDGIKNYEPFCSVDYAQMLGGGKAYVDAGMKVADPLDFLARVNSEASENVEATANAKNAALEAESSLWSKLSDELTLDVDGRIIKKIGDRAAAHFKRINSHEMASDMIGNLPLCKEKVIATGNKVEARGFYKCEDIKEFSVASDTYGITTPFDIQKWAFYGAKNLETITLPGQVKVEEMALRNIGGTNAAPKTVNFATNIYEGEGNNSISLDQHALSSTTKCGVTCDADYKASDSASHPLCDLGSGGTQNDLNSAQCNFDNDLFAQKNNNATKNFNGETYNDGHADRFLKKTIDRNTKLVCESSSDGLKVIDVQLPANCGKLTIGNLTQCSKLTHIYIKRNAGCALTQLDTSGAKIGANVQFIWSDDTDVVDQIKAEADFSAASAHKLSFGVANTIEHVGGTKVTDGEVCSKETENPAGDATAAAAAAAVKQLLKLPFNQGLSGTGQNATAVFKCLNSTGSAENCVAQDVADAQTLHRGFLCEIDTNDAQKINCDGGKLELKSDYVPTEALVDLWDASNSASCTNADAEYNATNKCAFGGIQSFGALPAAGSKSNVQYRCVEANTNKNETIDRVCVVIDIQDAANSHYGLTCTTPASTNSTCTNTTTNSSKAISQFGDANECGNGYTHTQGTDNRAKIVCVNAASADHTAFHIDPTGHDLDVVSSQPWKPGALAEKAGGAQSYLLSDGVTLTDHQLSKVCPKASEVIVPNSVTKLGVGFVINLNTEATGTLDVYIGDSVSSTASTEIAIDETANVLPNDVNNVAAFFRRCPADGTRKYEFDNLTPRNASGEIDRTATTAASSTKLDTMNEMSRRNLENGIVDTCLN